MRKWEMVIGVLAGCVVPLTGCSGTQDARAMPTQELASAVEGVSEYLDETREGVVFYHDGYYIHLRVPKEYPVGEMGLTDQDKVQLWDAMALVAGTYTISGDTCTNKILYSKNPMGVGDEFKWVGEVRGDTILWGVLDGEGGYSDQGRSLIIR